MIHFGPRTVTRTALLSLAIVAASLSHLHAQTADDRSASWRNHVYCTERAWMNVAVAGVSGYFPVNPDAVIMADIIQAPESTSGHVRFHLPDGDIRETVVPDGDMWELMNHVADCRTLRELGTTLALADPTEFDARITTYGPAQSRPLVVGVGEDSVTLMRGVEGWTLNGERIRSGHRVTVGRATWSLVQLGDSRWFAARVMASQGDSLITR